MRTRNQFSAVIALMAVMALPPAVAKAGNIYNLEIKLDSAVGKGDTLETRRAIDLWIEIDGNEWKPVAGNSPTHSNGNHYGRVVQGNLGASDITLTLDMIINRTEFIPGGRGKYNLTLTRKPDGTITGRFTGTYEGINFVWWWHRVDVQGSVSGKIIGPVTKAPGWTPLALCEHPRVLFRKADLPYLRAKAKTSFGQAAMARFNDALGNAMKYQLTGEPQYAELSRKAVVDSMASTDQGAGSGRYGWAPRWEQIALSYDLCYDAWPDSFRKQVQQYFTGLTKDVYTMADSWGGGEMSYRILGHASVLYESMGMAGMAMLNDSGPTPPRPPYPFGDSVETPAIPPLPDSYVPDSGVPVVRTVYGPVESIHKFKNCPMPGYWLYVTGLHPKPGEDPLAPLGGLRNARPKPGDKVTCNGKTATFALTASSMFFTDGFCGPTLDLTIMSGRDFYSTSYLFTILNNDESRYVEFNSGGYKHPEQLPYAELYINGIRRTTNSFIHLDKGRYALMLVLPIKFCGSWGKIFTASRLVEPIDDRRNESTRLMLDDWQWRLNDNAYETNLWKARNSQLQYINELFYKSRMNMRWYMRDAIAESGVFPRYLSNHGMDEMAMRYLPCYEKLFGEVLNPALDVHMQVTSQLLKCMQASIGQGSPNTFFGPLFSLVPDDGKPQVLGAWNQAVGVKNAANPVEVLDGRTAVTAHSFINYPLGGVGALNPAAENPSARPTLTARIDARRDMLLSWSVPAGQTVDLTVFDSRGATVARHHAAKAGPGVCRIAAGSGRTAIGWLTALLTTEDGNRLTHRFIMQ